MDINEKIRYEFNELSTEYEVYGVFLYGSQNYGLATAESDIDTKAIIIPSFEELIHRSPVSKTVKFAWGECDVKDVRTMMNMYKKQNVNFIETLFTDYFYVNPKYAELHSELMANREEIARLDEHRAIECMNGLMMQGKHRLNHITETTQADIQEYGYHRKSLMNIAKMGTMLSAYIDGASYKNVLDTHKVAEFREKPHPIQQVNFLVDFMDKKAQQQIHAYVCKPTNYKLMEWLNTWTETLIATYIVNSPKLAGEANELG